MLRAGSTQLYKHVAHVLDDLLEITAMKAEGTFGVPGPAAHPVSCPVEAAHENELRLCA